MYNTYQIMFELLVAGIYSAYLSVKVDTKVKDTNCESAKAHVNHIRAVAAILIAASGWFLYQVKQNGGAKTDINHIYTAAAAVVLLVGLGYMEQSSPEECRSLISREQKYFKASGVFIALFTVYLYNRKY